MNIKALTKAIHENAVEHGWWEEERSFPEIIALCHSELSEALEEYRNRFGVDETYYTCSCEPGNESTSPHVCKFCHSGQKPEGIAIELADCIIRILDYCGKMDIDIENAILTKHEYNKTRPYRHGGKVI